MSEPIRILHVLASMNLAGTETLLMNLYRNIDRNKVQFDFAVSETNECAYDQEINSKGGKIIHYPRYKIANHFVYKNWWKKFLSTHPEYKIIHGHIGSTAAIYLSIAKSMGRYTIAHSHSINSTLTLHSILYKMYSYPTRNIADYFFGCSQRALIDRYGSKIANNPAISKVLNNAIDAKKFIYNPEVRKKIRNEYNASKNALVIGTVGRLTPPKNPYEIIRICEELKKRNVEYIFWWFGTGEMEAEIRKVIAYKKLGEQVKLMGTRFDVYNILQGMDIFLFPSVWEGLGIACVEAQAAGLPTLCSDTIPIEAKVTEHCFFLPLNKTDQWCEAIESIANQIKKNPGYERPYAYQSILDAGFDIQDISKWLQCYYESIGKIR